jgi:hypothetical protein
MKLNKTITSIFLVPLLKIPKDAMRANNFVNGFIKDAEKDVQYEDAVYLLFYPDNIDKFREFLISEYERCECIIDDYDYFDNKFVVVVYKLDGKYKEDIELVKQGKYSKTSKEFQEEFPQKVNILEKGFHRNELSLQYRIFNRTEDLIKFWNEKLESDIVSVLGEENFEVWEGFQSERETLTLIKLKEYEQEQ